jgi:hypothetical protein
MKPAVCATASASLEILPRDDSRDNSTNCAVVVASNAAFVVVGMIGAWSFHCFLADPSFVQHLYRYTSSNPHAVPTHPDLWNNVLNYITLVRLVSNTLTQMFNLTPLARRATMTARIAGGIVLMIFVMITPIIVVASHAEEVAGFSAILFAVAASGVGTGFQQSTLFALASLYPGYSFSMSALFGMAASAAVTSIAKVITKVSYGDSFEDEKQEATLFFIIGAAWAAVGLAALLAFRFGALGRAAPLLGIVGALPSTSVACTAGGESGSSAASVAPTDEAATVTLPRPSSGGLWMGSAVATTNGSLVSPLMLQNEEGNITVGDPEPSDDDSETNCSVLRRFAFARVLLAGLPFYCAIGIVNMVEFALYPGVIMRVDNDGTWYKIWVTLAFNLALAAGLAAAQLLSKLVGGPARLSTGRVGAVLILVALVRGAVGCIAFIAVLADEPSRTSAAYVVAVAFEFVGGVASGIVAKAVPTIVETRIRASDTAARGVAGIVLSLSILLPCIIGTLANLALCRWVV